MGLKIKLIHLLGGVPYDFHRKAEHAFMEKSKLIDKTPTNCNRGAWCRSCVFSKESYITVGSGSNMHVRSFFYCVKDECCKHYKEANNGLDEH